MDFGARFYDPLVGRFTSPDPIMDVSSANAVNPYVYCSNNPLRYTDKFGLSKERSKNVSENGGRRGNRIDPTGHLLWDPHSGFLDFINTREYDYHAICTIRHGWFLQECQARDQAGFARENTRDYNRLKALHDIDMFDKALGRTEIETGLLKGDELPLDEAQLQAMIELFDWAAKIKRGKSDFAGAIEGISGSPAEGTGSVGEYPKKTYKSPEITMKEILWTEFKGKTKIMAGVTILELAAGVYILCPELVTLYYTDPGVAYATDWVLKDIAIEGLIEPGIGDAKRSFILLWRYIDALPSPAPARGPAPWVNPRSGYINQPERLKAPFEEF